MEITVNNIKYGACVGTITKKLYAGFNTDSAGVNIEQDIVNINLEDSKRDKLSKILLGLGYPEIDCVQGLKSAKAKARSFVSYAIRKMNK